MDEIDLQPLIKLDTTIEGPYINVREATEEEKFWMSMSFWQRQAYKLNLENEALRKRIAELEGGKQLS